ncbi:MULTISPECIES: TIGR03943 family putative permease subunit [Amycolatopsis]|uniref:TIGR03943 family putative permease subunit n=1 Tax=Amycolatopsis TaxID=1813 RepID=UPI0033AA1428
MAAPSPDTTRRVPFPPLPPGEVVPMRFTDVITRAGWDSAGTLDSRTIQVTGFVVRNKAGAPFLARIVINCCAADAFPLHARLVGDNLGHYRDDQWLTVTGTVAPNTATESNRYTPTLIVHSARPIPTPQDTYEY